ncbi:MAG: phenylglyoxylate dehydrogenase [Alphaproteobacteria bacterium]|nr:phenylglyoxylate dehydrogenase [Alphaproteobacteria bacterium]
MGAFNSLTYNATICLGCGECMMACAKAKSGDADRFDQSRIKIVPAGDNKFEAALCRQCGDAKCVMNCPAGALTKNAASGVVDWNADLCVSCLLCTVGCAYGSITFESSVGHVAKCDTCGGDPACVKVCKSGALGYVTTASIYNDYGKQEDLFAPGLAACQGCNSELMIRHVLRRVGRNVVVAAPPGCIPGMGTVGYNGKAGAKVPIFHPLLTNTASMLAGLKRTYERQGRDVTALALAGDGGASDVGFQSLSGAAERGEHILFLCFDNEGYMNTGMQASSATSFGSWTSTTPVGDKLQGKRTDAKNLPMVMMMHNAAYVATASSVFMEDFYRKLDKALAASKQGFAYLHLYAPCPSGWRFPASLTIDVCRLMVESNFVTLWEYTPETGLVFTRPTDKPKPLESYLKAIGKYRHLAQEQVDRIKKLLEDRLAMLKRFVR